MKKITLYIFVFTFIACKSNDGMELKVLDENISISMNDKKFVSLIRYSITNNSKDTYYFNNMTDTDSLYIKGVYKSGKVIKFFRDNGQEVIYKDKIPKSIRYLKENEQCLINDQNKMSIESSRLGYKEIKRYEYSKGGYTNFIIHPDETLFFEYYINVMDTMTPAEDFRLKYPEITNKYKYHSKLLIASDSTNYRSVLPREIIETIKKNKFKVYHGILMSKDDTCVKVVN